MGSTVSLIFYTLSLSHTYNVGTYVHKYNVYIYIRTCTVYRALSSLVFLSKHIFGFIVVFTTSLKNDISHIIFSQHSYIHVCHLQKHLQIHSETCRIRYVCVPMSSTLRLAPLMLCISLVKITSDWSEPEHGCLLLKDCFCKGGSIHRYVVCLRMYRRISTHHCNTVSVKLSLNNVHTVIRTCIV